MSQARVRRGRRGLPGLRVRSTLCGALAWGGARAPTVRTTPAVLVVLALSLCSEVAAGGTTVGRSLWGTEVGARAAGLGGAMSARAGGSESLAYNPAGLAQSVKEVRASGGAGLAGTYTADVGVAAALGSRAGVGARGATFHGGTLDILNFDGTEKSMTAQSDWAVTTGLGVKVYRDVAVGMSGSVWRSVLADEAKASAVLGGAGVQGALPAEWTKRVTVRAGFSWLGWGGPVQYEGGLATKTTEPMASVWRGGMAATWAATERVSLTGATDAAQVRGEDVRGHFGAEAGWDTRYFVRSGLRIGGGQGARVSVGGGVKLGRMSVDYAVGIVEPVATQHRVEVGWGW